MGTGKKNSTSLILQTISKQPRLSAATHLQTSNSIPITSHANRLALTSLTGSKRDFSISSLYQASTRLWGRKAEQPTEVTEKSSEPGKPKLPLIKVIIPHANISPGYQKIHTGFRELIRDIAALSVTSPTAAAAWLSLTEQMLWQSRTGMAILATGVGIGIERMIKAERLHRYSYLSAMTNHGKLSLSETENQQAQAIMAGKNPEIRYTWAGIEISGTRGNIEYPSAAREQALKTIHAMARPVFPNCYLTEKGLKIMTHAHSRWVERPFLIPYALVKILHLKTKDPKNVEKNALAIASHYLHDGLTGASVGHAKYKFRKAIKGYTEGKEILNALIAPELLENGAASCFDEWQKHNQGRFSLRVGRFKSIVAYAPNVRRCSWGGPVELEDYPQANNHGENNDDNDDENRQESRLFLR